MACLEHSCYNDYCQEESSAPPDSQLRFGQRPHMHFADKALRALQHEHGYRVRHVFWGERFCWIFGSTAGKLRGHAPGTNDAHADPVATQVFRHTPAQSLKPPLGCAVQPATGESIFSRERTDIDDVSAPALNHERADGTGHQKNALEVGV